MPLKEAPGFSRGEDVTGVDITFIETDWSSLKIQPAARDWCRLPYPGHPRGCPNYGKKAGCPPDAPLLGDFFDPARPVCFAVAKFDLAAHAKRLIDAHPGFTERQARCCLYWQNTVRKALREAVAGYMSRTGYTQATTVPEAMGLNVLRTLNLLGVPVKRFPKQYVYKVAMLGFRRE